MNINAISSLLSELTYQNSNVSAPATRTEAVSQVRDATAAMKETLEAEGVKASALQTAPAETPQQKAEQPYSIPPFIPLPLRTDLFKEARFFARLGEEKTEGGSREAEEFFICLITENLGRIWVGVACRSDFLSVKCFTDQEGSNKVLRQNFPPLREELKTIGFSEVSLTSQARAELGAVVEGLLPKFEEHLFDRKI
ncbi:flagellar hook-length control protein FliK [Pelotomaculum propionicicum]|uniref:flagellar hook-length control protein FliK n=1 Tax=Pelotomaculum propionicicum TaxID=258475 RepID=UPI003B7C6100